ncbi:hypothetical protein T01_12690 [Trichinella spiralis]|uniref:Uncharacterized protein n=1 Tax=Trichinella spiralis TaxID=6334 RepID=A0A0V1BQE8_TRISP|nr:hypothetical protein T01_12690 [Trichinella spiralis]
MIEGTGEKNNCTIELLNKICATKWFQQRKGKECMPNVIWRFVKLRKVKSSDSCEFNSETKTFVVSSFQNVRNDFPEYRSEEVEKSAVYPRVQETALNRRYSCRFKITDICQYV